MNIKKYARTPWRRLGVVLLAACALFFCAAFFFATIAEWPLVYRGEVIRYEAQQNPPAPVSSLPARNWYRGEQAWFLVSQQCAADTEALDRKIRASAAQQRENRPSHPLRAEDVSSLVAAEQNEYVLLIKRYGVSFRNQHTGRPNCDVLQTVDFNRVYVPVLKTSLPDVFDRTFRYTGVPFALTVALALFLMVGGFDRTLILSNRLMAWIRNG